MEMTFIARANGTTVSLWSPERAEDYAADCATGRAYAREFIAGGNPSLLPRIVAAMPRGDDLSGVEIGFLTGLAGVAV